MNKASANIRFYKNENGPVIGVTVRPVIEKDGLYFRDLTGDGRLAPYKDWRNTPAVRAASLPQSYLLTKKLACCLSIPGKWEFTRRTGQR